MLIVNTKTLKVAMVITKHGGSIGVVMTIKLVAKTEMLTEMWQLLGGVSKKSQGEVDICLQYSSLFISHHDAFFILL